MPRELSKPRVVAPGAGEIIGDSADRRVEILSDCDELHATWSRFAAGRDGAGLHIHHEHSDLFYVLEGELTVRVGEDPASDLVAGAGTLVHIPPMVVHAFRNGGDVEVKYLNLHAPGCGFADYMRGLRDGVDVDFDQDEPGGEGLLPASEISVTSGDGVLSDSEAIWISVTEVESGAPPITRAGAPRGTSGVESFYILSGDVAFELEDREGLAAPGTWLQTPLFTPSELSFGEGGAARFLTVQTPRT
jgi:mannose-6-phosphate isomerase-like protein (cupin superfamily)